MYANIGVFEPPYIGISYYKMYLHEGDGLPMSLFTLLTIFKTRESCPIQEEE